MRRILPFLLAFSACGPAPTERAAVEVTLANGTSRGVVASVSVSQRGGSSSVASGVAIAGGESWSGVIASDVGDVVTYHFATDDGTATGFQHTVTGATTSCVFVYRDVCITSGPNQPCTPAGSEIRGACN